MTSVPTHAAPLPLSPTCPSPVRRAWLRNRWDDLTFVHWPYDADEVQALLPDGLRVDTFEERAWVSLVPFRMRRAGPTWLPPLPWISTFAETNVRTYVVDAAGHRAVWFLSLDATRLPVVAFARWAIGFPYVWSDMEIDVPTGGGRGRWAYVTARRRWPHSPAARTKLVVDVGDPVEPTPLDEFLTARWGTVAEWRGRLRHHPVDHPPWVLRSATVVELADTAVAASGLTPPSVDPLVRVAEPLDARFGRPQRV